MKHKLQPKTQEAAGAREMVDLIPAVNQKIRPIKYDHPARFRVSNIGMEKANIQTKALR